MFGKPVASRRVPWLRRTAGALFWVAAWAVGPAAAQTTPLPPLDVPAAPAVPQVLSEAPAPAAAPTPPAADPEIKPAGCSSCGALPPPPLDGDCCGNGCPTGHCRPGQKGCGGCCFGDGLMGRLCGGCFECLCCKDPCYEGRWMPIADSAFFLDAARPITHTRLRYRAVWDLEFPDKAEFFWARRGGKGPVNAENKVDFYELALYNEVAADRIGIFVEVPYRHLDPERNLSTSGFADINIGTKTLMFDTELMQLSTQFKTFIPTASPGKGLSTGHVTLEPSLLGNLRLSPVMYMQAQAAYAIAVGGDQRFQGNYFHGHTSLNRILWKPSDAIQLIGTAEMGYYYFFNGLATAPTGAVVRAEDVGKVFNLGPGLRLFVCEKYDVGAGAQFAISNDNVGRYMLHVDLRMRF